MPTPGPSTRTHLAFSLERGLVEGSGIEVEYEPVRDREPTDREHGLDFWLGKAPRRTGSSHC